MSKVDEVLQKYMDAAGIVLERGLNPGEANAVNATAAKIDANADNDPGNDQKLTPDEEKTKVLLGQKKKKDADAAAQHTKNVRTANSKVSTVVANNQPPQGQ